jgi:hypothetical protein
LSSTSLTMRRSIVREAIFSLLPANCSYSLLIRRYRPIRPEVLSMPRMPDQEWRTISTSQSICSLIHARPFPYSPDPPALFFRARWPALLGHSTLVTVKWTVRRGFTRKRRPVGPLFSWTGGKEKVALLLTYSCHSHRVNCEHVRDLY